MSKVLFLEDDDALAMAIEFNLLDNRDLAKSCKRFILVGALFIVAINIAVLFVTNKYKKNL